MAVDPWILHKITPITPRILIQSEPQPLPIIELLAPPPEHKRRVSSLASHEAHRQETGIHGSLPIYTIARLAGIDPRRRHTNKKVDKQTERRSTDKRSSGTNQRKDVTNALDYHHLESYAGTLRGSVIIGRRYYRNLIDSMRSDMKVQSLHC